MLSKPSVGSASSGNAVPLPLSGIATVVSYVVVGAEQSVEAGRRRVGVVRRAGHVGRVVEDRRGVVDDVVAARGYLDPGEIEDRDRVFDGVARVEAAVAVARRRRAKPTLPPSGRAAAAQACRGRAHPRRRCRTGRGPGPRRRRCRPGCRRRRPRRSSRRTCPDRLRRRGIRPCRRRSGRSPARSASTVASTTPSPSKSIVDDGVGDRRDPDDAPAGDVRDCWSCCRCRGRPGPARSTRPG